MKEIWAKISSLKWVPNFLTICNSLCGFAAILYSLRIYEQGVNHAEVYAISAYIILFAMIFDALDGFVARKLNATSLYGVQMDSLSDMVTFGLAPAIIVAIMTHSLRGGIMSRWQEILTYCLCSIYIGGAALRLAKYNVHAMVEHKSSDKFAGLPSPGAAAAICSAVILAQSYNWSLKYLAIYLPIYAAFLGLLMVSNIPYTHAGKWLFSIRRNPRRFAMFIIMVLVVIFFHTIGVFALITLYLLSGLLNLLKITLKHEKE